MLTIDFSQPRGLEGLASVLGCSVELLGMLSGEGRENLYYKHSIPKRRKPGIRVVYEPVGLLRFIQRGFERRFDAYCRKVVTDYPHAGVCGFVRGGSTRRNALLHCGSSSLLRVDIRNFFASISRSRVEAMLKGFGVFDASIPAISGLVTVLDLVAEGLPTSPMISNLVALDLDRQLADLATKFGVVYTRYADDMSFSAHSIGSELPTVEEVGRIVETHGFALAAEKSRRSKPGQAHFVTGLSVQIPGRPTLPKRMSRRMRQELYYVGKYGAKGHAQRLELELKEVVNRIDGRLNFFCGIDKAKWSRHKQFWNDRLAQEELGPSYPSAHFRGAGLAQIAIDESIVEVNGDIYMCLAATEICFPAKGPLAEEVLEKILTKLRDDLRNLAEKYHQDPYSAGRVDHLAHKGLYFTDDPMDLQTKVVEFLATLPIQIYLVFKHYGGNDYEECYLHLLGSLLRGRLAARRQDALSVVLESNPQVDESKAQSLINGMHSQIGGCRPLRVSSQAKISEPLLAVADYSAGIFFSQRKNQAIQIQRFERLRHRYRYIANLSHSLRFNRRHPLHSFGDAFRPVETKRASSDC